MKDNNKVSRDYCPTCGKKLSMTDYLELVTTPPMAVFTCSKCPVTLPKLEANTEHKPLTSADGVITYSAKPTPGTATPPAFQVSESAPYSPYTEYGAEHYNYNPNFPGRDRPDGTQPSLFEPVSGPERGCYYCGDKDSELWPLYWYENAKLVEQPSWVCVDCMRSHMFANTGTDYMIDDDTASEW